MALKEISKQPNIDSAPFLLVITLMQVYNEKEQVGQKEMLYKHNSRRVPIFIPKGQINLA